MSNECDCASKEWVEAKFEGMRREIQGVRESFETERDHIMQRRESHRLAHEQEHISSQKTLDRLDTMHTRSFDELRVSLTRLETTYASLVTRDLHDADINMLRDNVDHVERALRAEITADDARHQSAYTELKTKIAEVNASFQQSIVALGLILTIIEFWIRK